MNKAERKLLHSVLTRIMRGQDKMNERLDSIEASQMVIAALNVEFETDIKNIFHVLQETQRQQRAGSEPKLKVVPDERPRSPAE